MIAAVLYGKEHLQVESVAVPTIGDGDILVRVKVALTCGTDVKVFRRGYHARMIVPPALFGHELAGDVVAAGDRVESFHVGQRVVLNPWLTCGPRGVDPPCPSCRAGDLSLCWSFTTGPIGPGVHVGVTAGAPGAWADLLAAHDSMLIPVPDSVPDTLAVLADPFAVSMHAVVRHPPPAGGKAVVYGAGALGITSVAVLRALYPDTEVAVVARFGSQAELARKMGADKVVGHEPRLQVVEELAQWSGGVLHTPIDGLPVAHPGGIDVVYDTIAKPETLEVGVRVLAERGTLVQSGVHTPGRWEWTPLYFKELTLAGSNAFGVEEIDGVRKHAIEHYLDMAASGRVDLTGMLTHRFPLEQWWAALMALARQGDSGAIKVAFEPGTPGR
jgi:threonine dehydrogenase-like Zn-dependent dehydrogenase